MLSDQVTLLNKVSNFTFSFCGTIFNKVREHEEEVFNVLPTPIYRLLPGKLLYFPCLPNIGRFLANHPSVTETGVSERHFNRAGVCMTVKTYVILANPISMWTVTERVKATLMLVMTFSQ
jgi:hypothetical protein